MNPASRASPVTTPAGAVAAPLLLSLRIDDDGRTSVALAGQLHLGSSAATGPAAVSLSEGAVATPAPRVWRVTAADDVLAHAERLAQAERIDIVFDKFTDGRGFSSARLLRERVRYRGRLRAVGDVVVDILGYLQRCGFDEFALRPDQDPAAALAALSRFSAAYQGASDARTPIHALRARAASDLRPPLAETGSVAS